MKMRLNFFILAVLAILIAGCATLENHKQNKQKTETVSNQQKVSINQLQRRSVIDYAIGNVVHY